MPTLTTADPHIAATDERPGQTWQQWAGEHLLDWVSWTQANPDAAGREYDTFAAQLRSMRDALCTLHGLYDRARGDRREVLRGQLCDLVGRYARYCRIVYGSTSRARGFLYPPGEVPCDVGPLSPDGTRLQACVGGWPAALAVVAVASAVALVTWVRTDLTRTQELIAAAERGVAPETLKTIGQGSSLNPLSAAAGAAGTLALVVGVAAVAAVAYSLTASR